MVENADSVRPEQEYMVTAETVAMAAIRERLVMDNRQDMAVTAIMAAMAAMVEVQEHLGVRAATVVMAEMHMEGRPVPEVKAVLADGSQKRALLEMTVRASQKANMIE